MSRPKKSLAEIARDTHRDLNAVPLTALTQREIVTRVLYLANETATDQQKEAGQLISMLSHGFTVAQTKKLAELHGSDFLRRVWNGFAPERDRFREQLELLQKDRTRARNKLRDQIASDLEDVVPVPELVLTNDWKVKTETRYIALSLPAACAFALALLLDESTGFGDALKRCKLALCSNFFLSLPSPKGGRPPEYCCRDHQAMYAAQTGAERMERHRKKKAAERRSRS